MATEKRLIDANDACESLCKKCGLDRGECERIGFCADYMDIKRFPTVDAVEVVRCKDCKNRGDEGMCPMYWIEEIQWDDDRYAEVDYVLHDYTTDDGFCCYGEKLEV